MHCLAHNFGELNEAQAVIEAARCLKCYDAPCIKGCPVQIDIPKFIFRISTRDYKGAAKVIKEKNVLGTICARVCPADNLCQKACSGIGLGGSIAISALQDFAMQHGLKQKSKECCSAAAEKGQKVAVIGAGPSGLAAAAELRKLGYSVTLYEKEAEVGGIPAEEIPAYRLNKEIMKQELDRVLCSGIELKLGVRLDSGNASDILNEYDAVYLATGLGKQIAMFDKQAKGIFFAEDFLKKCNKKQIAKEDIGDTVVIIGGGNTAMDAAVCSKLAGAKDVIVMYRRSQFEMPAWEREFKGAIEAGIQFLWQSLPTDIELKDGKVESVTYCKVMLGEADASGRKKTEPDLTRHRLPVDTVVYALGREANIAIAEAFKLEKDQKGRIKTENYQTSSPKIFAGGELINGGSTVVQAVADGKKAAQEIAKFLSALVGDIPRTSLIMHRGVSPDLLRE